MLNGVLKLIISTIFTFYYGHHIYSNVVQSKTYHHGQVGTAVIDYADKDSLSLKQFVDGVLLFRRAPTYRTYQYSYNIQIEGESFSGIARETTDKVKWSYKNDKPHQVWGRIRGSRLDTTLSKPSDASFLLALFMTIICGLISLWQLNALATSLTQLRRRKS